MRAHDPNVVARQHRRTPERSVHSVAHTHGLSDCGRPGGAERRSGDWWGSREAALVTRRPANAPGPMLSGRGRARRAPDRAVAQRYEGPPVVSSSPRPGRPSQVTPLAPGRTLKVASPALSRVHRATARDRWWSPRSARAAGLAVLSDLVRWHPAWVGLQSRCPEQHEGQIGRYGASWLGPRSRGHGRDCAMSVCIGRRGQLSTA